MKNNNEKKASNRWSLLPFWLSGCVCLPPLTSFLACAVKLIHPSHPPVTLDPTHLFECHMTVQVWRGLCPDQPPISDPN